MAVVRVRATVAVGEAVVVAEGVAVTVGAVAVTVMGLWLAKDGRGEDEEEDLE